MKKIIFSAILSSIIILGACAPPGDNQAQLTKLENKRDALNKKIETLKQEIAAEGAGSAAKTEKIVHVNVAQVDQDVFKHYIKVQGTVESDNNILISPSSSGIVKKIHVYAGDRIKKGQLLAELDGAILESSIVELKNGLELAKTIFERQERLWNKNIGSEIEYLQAKTNKESLEKRLDTLNEQYKLTKITSPLSGTVDEVLFKEGEMAAAGFGVIRIVQLSNLKIKADISENYISRIKKNDMVQILIPSLNKEFGQSIHAVSQVIDSKNRTFRIEIKVPRTEKNVKPNMLAILTINDYTNPTAYTVPQKIVQETGDEQFLFIAAKEDNRWIARRRRVSSGEDYSGVVEILEGLQEGEYIVIFGFQNLADGQILIFDTSD